ncbi:DNA-directed RNA polymerase subunit beta' [Candidatus Collierbacteria bacterium CG10_big_fil_rev_8_21_14_0_10_44_9]|uniref:DNA-directed RNA polymerase subunit beta' n=1 Tax=Candidatus Collierbacteria bacterium CG10_big_fil_rev_8_21_14_0_10_44_9 TaxID=1974535 RepID=A0A2H0VIY4_9BACT|nr:MAG: DNA-directed RNA polymerase subunit beta' [Candidatus Collierbacteria bacterium CG10_big_fil_rev_8_21_14_0_10_44_9]
MTKNILDFKGLKISIASPETIRSWSFGEVLKPETINYRTLKPEKDGLFCERIFGPTKDYECYCGKYKRIRYRGIVCDKCGVEVTQARVRRERMGHINLATPVAHIWYFKGAPSKLSLLMNVAPKALSAVVYFAKYLVLAVDKEEKTKVIESLNTRHAEALAKLEETIKADMEKVKANLGDKPTERQINSAKKTIENLRESLVLDKDSLTEIYKTVSSIIKRIVPGTVITEDEYLKLDEYSAISHLKVGMGAEAILSYLETIDIQKLSKEIRLELKEGGVASIKRTKLSKRLKVVNGLKNAGLSPTWMILKVLPVLPPELRPMVQLSGGRFASSDLNDLYRRVINRNNRLKHLIDLGAPEIILRNEKRMLQEAVDSLIDASQAKTTRRRVIKPLRSLSDMLSGKQGRFRQNLLGKRVDYSGRSVIVVGPELKLSECGIPKDMALEMFKPYVLRELIAEGTAPNVKSAKHAIERKDPLVFDILERITKNHPVLLNRAPTLHKLGIQAFYPVLIEGNAIQLHPCVCSGFNADFDGDQMAIHVPLGEAAIEDAHSKMMAKNNLLKPANGSPITVPNKEMALGCYYLTSFNPDLKLDNSIYGDAEQAYAAESAGVINQRQPISVRVDGKIIVTSVGRLIFNDALPVALRFINDSVNAKKITDIIREAIRILDNDLVADLVDKIKSIGFKYLTTSGLSVAVADNIMIHEKAIMIKEADVRVNEILETFNQGLITEEEKRRLSFEVWMETTEAIATATWEKFDERNAVKIIIESGGTRASRDQVKQLSAMRGLVVDPLGKIVEMPTKSNFREGLSIFEYVNSSRGSRKGLTDSALKTADAGYLTRRLVDVSHTSIIREADCGSTEYLEIPLSGVRGKYFVKRGLGRIIGKTVKNPTTKEVIIKKGEMINDAIAELLFASGIESIEIRSPLTCKSRYGLCAACYGWDFGTRKLVELGSPVGVIAAQSIGEPGTQLTMRVKHAGGIVGLDVTQGLPRVEELFEARNPKIASPLAGIAGKVTIEEATDGHKVTITSTSNSDVKEEYFVPTTLSLAVKDKDLIAAGFALASGPQNIQEVLRIRGIRDAQSYLIQEIQAVYESQGIPISDKHFEVVVREMTSKVKIEDSGDTFLIGGEIVDRFAFDAANDATLAEGGEPATATAIMLGVTRAALHTHSWLSAASFEQTTNVLSESALEGKEDPLFGLKENVIIGRLIPTNPERAVIQ